MEHFQDSVMGLRILLRSLGWATKIWGEIPFPLPPGHPSSYFMTGPLASNLERAFPPVFCRSISGEISFPPPANPSSYFTAGPLASSLQRASPPSSAGLFPGKYHIPLRPTLAVTL